jgi:hypothetical protein
MDITKVCFRCEKEQPITEFYKHKAMADGHLNKCKTCTKGDTRKREEKLTSTPEGLEAERQRHRDKYHRLNYKDKQKEWDKDKPWKATQTYKNLHRKYKIPKGKELHHWNYHTEYLEDVFVMDRKQHRQAHRFLTFELDLRIFRTLEGKLLRTKEDHLKYLIEKGIKL